jgi:hypothetical protein
MQTTDLRTITKRGIALEPTSGPASRLVAKVLRRTKKGNLRLYIINGGFEATLRGDRLTIDEDPQGIYTFPTPYAVVYQGTLPSTNPDYYEECLDHVGAKIAAGEHGIVAYEDMPVALPLPRRTVARLVAHLEGQAALDEDVSAALDAWRAAAA